MSILNKPRLYEGAPNLGAMHESIQSMQGEHIMTGAHYFLTFAEIGNNPGLVDASTEEERQKHFGKDATWVELSSPRGIEYDLSSAGWRGIYTETTERPIKGKLRTLFGRERVILDAESVEEFRRHDHFFVVGDVACSAFAPKFAELESVWRVTGNTLPDYKRHFGVQYNRGLLLLSDLRKAGVNPEARLAGQPSELQELTMSRLDRLQELFIKGGITPLVASVLGWDSPSHLNPRSIARRVGAFKLDPESTIQKVIDTLMAQLESDDEMEVSAVEQSLVTRTTGGSSERYVATTATNVVTNLLGIR